MVPSIADAFRMFGEHMTESSKANMIYHHLRKELRDNPDKAYSFASMQKALDIPPFQEYSTMLQNAIARCYNEKRLEFNASKSSFKHRERM